MPMNKVEADVLTWPQLNAVINQLGKKTPWVGSPSEIKALERAMAALTRLRNTGRYRIVVAAIE